MPEISLDSGSNVVVVEQYKLLGQITRTDLKTISNSQNLCQRAYKRMWTIQRLKQLGCPNNELVDVLKQQIVSVCEQAVPAWGPMIAQHENNMIEHVLKTGLHIIFGQSYFSFQNALKLANMTS